SLKWNVACIALSCSRLARSSGIPDRRRLRHCMPCRSFASLNTICRPKCSLFLFVCQLQARSPACQGLIIALGRQGRRILRRLSQRRSFPSFPHLYCRLALSQFFKQERYHIFHPSLDEYVDIVLYLIYFISYVLSYIVLQF